MAIVKLFGNLRRYVDNSNRQVPGTNVQVVLETLCRDNPPLCDALLEDGVLRPHFKITINGHDMNLAAGLNTPVENDDQIAIFSPIAGG